MNSVTEYLIFICDWQGKGFKFSLLLTTTFSLVFKIEGLGKESAKNVLRGIKNVGVRTVMKSKAVLIPGPNLRLPVSRGQ